ncbi:hypothetical protein CsatB_026835 [Cannabis sativa]|uniref:Transmembrane protein n=2 Tax=Cannabis sativa TaxID=3483 RepID=A0A7J6H6M8_CANSA|nr:hypothetical protein G4B88_008489 [Cannabis sativa]KAF4355165.1 hypothetical protein G4B88_018055 [Cannabis sativa]KAF4390278.1 hypothetical protein F8388_019933 [Cannabis sativa]
MMMMKHKALMMITIIIFSYVLTLSSATSRRLIKNSNQGTSMVHEYLKAPHQIMKVDNNNIEIGEEFIEGRMDFEKSDYSGVGANPEHDPKPPSGNV